MAVLTAPFALATALICSPICFFFFLSFFLFFFCFFFYFFFFFLSFFVSSSSSLLFLFLLHLSSLFSCSSTPSLLHHHRHLRHRTTPGQRTSGPVARPRQPLLARGRVRLRCKHSEWRWQATPPAMRACMRLGRPLRLRSLAPDRAAHQMYCKQKVRARGLAKLAHQQLTGAAPWQHEHGEEEEEGGGEEEEDEE